VTNDGSCLRLLDSKGSLVVPGNSPRIDRDLGCVSSASLGLLSLKVVVEKGSLSMEIRRGSGGPNGLSNFSESDKAMIVRKGKQINIPAPPR
jgi:hypothetical protein